MPPDPLLEVDTLSVSFVTDAGRANVVEEVSFALRSGETVGLVGESGCGKSVTAMSIMRLDRSCQLGKSYEQTDNSRLYCPQPTGGRYQGQ